MHISWSKLWICWRERPRYSGLLFVSSGMMRRYTMSLSAMHLIWWSRWRYQCTWSPNQPIPYVTLLALGPKARIFPSAPRLVNIKNGYSMHIFPVRTYLLLSSDMTDDANQMGTATLLALELWLTDGVIWVSFQTSWRRNGITHESQKIWNGTVIGDFAQQMR